MKFVYYICLVLFCFNGSVKAHGTYEDPDWGFYSHRLINKYAVFTLPAEMMPLFKRQIKYIEENAINPDKRRYATKFEAIRHYIDLDRWGTYPFEDLPRKFDEALLKYAEFRILDFSGDTITLTKESYGDTVVFNTSRNAQLKIHHNTLKKFFRKHIMPQYYEDIWVVDKSVVNDYFYLSERLDFKQLIVLDRFSDYGVLPYYLVEGLAKLTKAFERQDEREILRHAADLGHYIGDAHVPLHTTANYNGQFTDQVGIHAFWESRIPELFAEKSFDFFVGKATYIQDPEQYFWDIVLQSHSLVDSVLMVEKQLSLKFPADQQWCYDERLGQTVRIQCREYAEAYNKALNGMIEERMAANMLAIGNIWYTAWINAGQPDLNKLVPQIIEPEIITPNPYLVVRPHED